MLVSELAVTCVSLALRRRTYVPGALKLAWVIAEAGLEKVTVPGPATVLHAIVKVEPKGRPSSVADPFSVAEFGKVIVCEGPALTTGGWFCGVRITVTVALLESCESLADSWNTYVPTTVRVTFVTGAVGLAMIAVGPLT
jgi:hypothetical protein